MRLKYVKHGPTAENFNYAIRKQALFSSLIELIKLMYFTRATANNLGRRVPSRAYGCIVSYLILNITYR